MAEDATISLDIEIGLKSGGSLAFTLLDGRDGLGQDPTTGALELVIRHSEDHQEKVTVAQDNIAYIRTMKRVERPARRPEDAGSVVLVGETPQPA